MLVEGAANALFRPGLRKDFRDDYMLYEPEWPDFLREGTMDLPEIKATIMTGFSRLVEIGDGEPITLDTPKMGNIVMGMDREFGLGFAISRKTIEDDQYNKANQSAKWLSQAAQLTREYRAAALLDDAFTGTIFNGIDGNRLCYNTHTLINSSSTVANTPATQVGLSVTGVSALLDLAMTLKNENGDPIKCNIDKLIISNSSGELNRALQILGSDKEPFTAENQDNAIKKRIGGIKPIISRYKTSTKSYFMVDSKMNDAWFLTKRPVTFEDDTDFYTGAALYKVTTRFLIWFVDWRGWFGMNPT